MVYFRTGSQARRLVTLLSVAGEFPIRSIEILGNERVYKALIHKLTAPDDFYNPQTGTKLSSTRLFTVTGKGAAKSLKLYKGALPILDWVGAAEYYLRAFQNHRFPGDAAHIERNHRVAEALAMCLRANIEFRPYCLPALQNTEIKTTVPDWPAFYQAKLLKQVGTIEMNKTMFSRLVGALFAGGNCYTVYNTRSASMKWSGMGEFKTQHNLIEIGRLNAGVTVIDSAILFGHSDQAAWSTLQETEKNRRLEFRFDSIYRYIHFVPMTRDGIRQLKLMTRPDWKENILDLLFASETRSFNRGAFEYDACVNGVFVLCHLDGDIARLIRFREAIGSGREKSEVLCFPDQAALVREFLGGLAGIKVIDRSLIEAGLGMDKEGTT